MIKNISLALPPQIAFEETLLKESIFSHLHLPKDAEAQIRLLRRSIDARGRNVKINIDAEIYVGEPAKPVLAYSFDYKNVKNASEAIIVGSGPAGLFAALRLIELGIKPIIFERGKDIQSRRRDLAAINKQHIVNPDSNYCFGEGGAGTYSDGKLYTRSTKRGDIRRILEILVNHGAKDEILIDAHPHIGTNKLPRLVTSLRETIIEYGGEVHFNSRIMDFIIEDEEMKGVVTQDGIKHTGIGVILATGHSARDIFELLYEKKVIIESKPFAMGVRIEHAQSLIDTIQYHGFPRGEYLPAAAYSLVCQANYKNAQKGVFSFCMCPGGFIVAAATAPGEVVVNGMSPSKRDSKYANSGIVVTIGPEDLKQYQAYGPLAGLQMQRELEQKACMAGGGTQTAPAQRMIDFVDKKLSSSLLDTSYIPGITSAPLHDVLPEDISARLRIAFIDFGKKMKGYYTNDAQMLGVESRTSSPVRVPRDKETYEHIQIKRIFPCGEGAGYAGGIVSAAMDGEKCAEMLVERYNG